MSNNTAYPPSKDSLARIVDADGGRDEAENSYYEACADPDYVRQETMQRRFRGHMEKTDLFGRGMRYRARYVDPDGAESGNVTIQLVFDASSSAT